ncbi:MAG: hypothetical protein ABR903_05855 [Thermodesulfovibrionales bacterium]
MRDSRIISGMSSVDVHRTFELELRLVALLRQNIGSPAQVLRFTRASAPE